MKRATDETTVEITWGEAIWIKTGIPMFDHLLTQMAKCWGVGLRIEAKGDCEHHVIEDVAICLGQELLRLDKKERFGSAIIPMDDALAIVALDFSGRGFIVENVPTGMILGGMVRHFYQTLADNGKFNLHVVVLRGYDEHHKVEATFKALGRALKESNEDKDNQT